MDSPSSPPHRVAVLLLAPAIGFDATIPSLVFSAARTECGEPLYAVDVVTADGAPTTTVEGYGIVPSAGPEALARAQTVIVPGTRNPAARRAGRLDGPAAAAFAAIPAEARVAGICTGAFALAAAGLLDGRRAATHWEQAEAMRALYPRVDVDERSLYVDEGRILTSAGLAAGLDLCLHIVRRDAGAAVAARAARHCVIAPFREGGQAQYIAPHEPPPRADDGIGAALAWARRRLGEPLTVAALARRAGLSERTFARRFAARTGTSPGAWLRAERIAAAQRLLEETALPVDAVAARAGFGTSAALRIRMQAALGTTPSAYRRRFRGVPGGAATGPSGEPGGTRPAATRVRAGAQPSTSPQPSARA